MNYLQYNDPLIIQWRKGTLDDPYIDKTQEVKVINKRVVLEEIPDKLERVSISGYFEVDENDFIGSLQSNEFIVNYSTGIITFSETEEGEILSVQYKGRGMILYPASRIYAHTKDNPEVEQNLQDIIDNSQAGIDALSQVTTAIESATNLHGVGNYSLSTAYKKNNIVAYNGSTYLAIQDSVGILPTDTSYWQFMVSNDWSALTNKPSSSVSDIDDAVSKRHAQNTDTMLTGNVANVINTNSSNNIVDFKVSNVTKASIDNNGKFSGTIDWININNIPANIDDTIAKRHTQNTDNTLTNSSANTINTTGSGNIVDFKVNSVTIASINNLGKFTGVASKATILEQSRNFSVSGDVTATAQAFDGSTNITLNAILANSGVIAGTYTKVTVDAKGRVTVGDILTASDIPNISWSKITSGKPTTRDGYGITDVYLKSEVDSSLSSKLNLSGGTLSGFLTLFSDGVNPMHAVTKQQLDAVKAYIDAVKQSLDPKDSVRVATTANITLSGVQSIDGIALSIGDRVLVKDQTVASQNGIYVVSSGAWTRAIDADSDGKVTSGMYMWVTDGTANIDSGWILITKDTIVLGTTNLQFAQFNGAGQLLAGTGLTKSGNTISLSSTGVTASTYTKVTVDQYGRVTNGQNGTTLSFYGITDAMPNNANASTTGTMTATRFISTIANGTAPFQVSSTTTVPNLSAERLNGQLGSYYAPIDSPVFTGTPTLPLTVITSHLQATDASEHAFKKNNASAHHGLYVNDAKVGLFDWKNSIDIIGYSASGNSLVLMAGSSLASSPSPSDNSTKIATTAYVKSQNYLLSTGVTNEFQPSSGLFEGLTWYKSSTDTAKMYLNGAFRDIGGTPPVISTTQPSTGLKEGLVWYNPTEREVKMYLNGGFVSSGGGSNSSLLPATARITLVSSQSSFNHGITLYNKDMDIIFVYKNGTMIMKDIDYSVSSDGQTITCLNGSWLSGSIFDIIVISSIPSSNAFTTMRLENVVTVGSNGTSNILIGIPLFDKNTDALDVIVDGLILISAQDYSINANGISIDLNGWVLDSGRKIVFRVWKQVRTTSSGTQYIKGNVKNITVGTVAPSSPSVNDIWIDMSS